MLTSPIKFFLRIIWLVVVVVAQECHKCPVLVLSFSLLHNKEGFFAFGDVANVASARFFTDGGVDSFDSQPRATRESGGIS